MRFEFEFLFKANDNIVCQRFFDIKSKHQRFDFVRTMDSRYLVRDIKRLIEGDMKMKSKKFLWENFDSSEPNAEVTRRDLFENGDIIYSVELKCGNKFLIGRDMIVGNYYPKEIRKSIDVRPLMPTIIEMVNGFLSTDNYTKEYCGKKL